jgi:UDP-N-acetylglucosamine 4,6-dehydratase
MRNALEDNPRLRWFIGDVRDRDRLRRAFEGVDTVVHGAALKRIEVGAYNPIEMVKTNVLGAMNVVEAAQDAGVKKVVALSSDKAYQPISPYGQSKALMEGIVLAANNTTPYNGTQFAVTRYGNVAGSAGSVIPLWRQRIKDSQRIRITDPNCTRFWMTMDEAIDLVLDTIEKMPEELAIPDLPTFRLGDLAEAMGARDMEITGLPKWEKMHEGLRDGLTSDSAWAMSVEQLQEALERV